MTLLFVDQSTWIITVVGWGIVFIALVLLIFIFNMVPKILKINFKSTNKKDKKISVENADSEKYLSGDETAAIAMALHMFFNEQHDEESNVITIKRIQKRYSPWSSKIYGLRNVGKGY